MARVTVEDCVLKVPNRFELVMLAAHRSRAISAGEPLTVERDNDKNPVVSLREIADATVPVEGLREGLIRSLQFNAEVDEPEPEDIKISQDQAGLAFADVDRKSLESEDDTDE